MMKLAPGGIVGWLIGLVIQAFAQQAFGLLERWLADRAKEKKVTEKAVADAESKTLEEIKRTADEQARSDDADRGGASDVAKRVRDRLEKGRGGASDEGPQDLGGR